MFRIDVENLCWITGDLDNADDFCLHGHVVVQIGEETFDYNATASATGLYLLRTLTENHTWNDDNMLPCCGHFMIANEQLDYVDILGCSNGVNFEVIHGADNNLKIRSNTGKEVFICKERYANEVNLFADKIESFYKTSSPKNFDSCDDFERNGYIAFWNEWSRRRKCVNQYN